MAKQRLDVSVVERGLAETRARARALILAGDVLVNGARVQHASGAVEPADEITLRAKPRFVSRGGEKLAHALDRFGVDVAGAIAVDLGASTGGFTDCLVQRGARRIYAVDVGYGILDERLRADPRVVVMERTNARHLEALPEPCDLAVIDVSFISLSLVLPMAARLLAPSGRCIALIKPQFEAERDEVQQGGVVRDPSVHRRVLTRALAEAVALGMHPCDLTASPLRGPAGNIEFLALLEQSPYTTGVEVDARALIDRALAEASSAEDGRQ